MTPAERVLADLAPLEKAVRPRIIPAKLDRIDNNMNARVASQNAEYKQMEEKIRE